MKYITSLIQALISIPQSIFNLIVSFFGRSDLWVNWDMDWLVFLEVRRIKESMLKREEEKKLKLQEAEVNIVKAKENG